ncbi:hypothetical protein V6Z11_D12G088700 [Gossypium hirsutum]
MKTCCYSGNPYEKLGKMNHHRFKLHCPRSIVGWLVQLSNY